MFDSIYENNRDKRLRLIDSMNSHSNITEKGDWRKGLIRLLKYICKNSFVSKDVLNDALDKIDVIEEKFEGSNRLGIGLALIFILNEGIETVEEKPIIRKYKNIFGITEVTLKKYIDILIEANIIDID